MNRTELRWLGFSRRELVGARRFVSTLSPRCSRRYLRAFDALCDGAPRAGLHAEFVRKDGSVFPASIDISAVRDREGALVATRATVIVLSERRRAEKKLAPRGAPAHDDPAHRRCAGVRAASAVGRVARPHRPGPAAANLDLHLIKDLLVGSLPALDAARLDDAITRIEATAECVRDVAGALRPPVLDTYGLAVSLRTCAEQFARRAGIRIVVDAHSGSGHGDPRADTALFRVCQEALTNALRHSGAHAVRICLQRNDVEVRLSIADDGCGFDAGEAGAVEFEGLGILGMRERMLAVGGELIVESSRGAGTRIVARAPAH